MSTISRASRFLCALIQIAALILPALLGAHSQLPGRDATPSSGSAIIRGRVVDAESGRPLRGVVISVYANDRAAFGAVTSGDGRYQVAGVPAGRYRVAARLESYLALNYGQTRPNQDGRPLAITDRQVVENINFNLPRGGVIAGVLRNEIGQPMINTQVRALIPTYGTGRPILTLAGELVLTNDRGEYRIYGLPPGSVYVVATAPPPTPSEGPSFRYSPTYFPGTTSFGDASRVNVKLGTTVNSVDINIVTMRTGSFSLKALDSENRPLTNPVPIVRQLAAGVLVPISVPRVGADGSFKLGDLPPGGYEIRITGVSSGPDKTPLGGVATVTVGSGEEVKDVRLPVTRLSSGTGRVVLDSLRPATIGQISLTLTDVTDRMAYQPRASLGLLSRVQMSDLSFTLRSLPGRFYLSVSELPAGWYLRGVRLEGQDVTDSGIEFRPEATFAGIELELTNRPSELSGTVRTPSGSVADDYTVVVFAQEPSRRTGLTRYFGTARPDATGKYSVRGLPPGEYFAIALDYADPEASADPAFLEPLARDATAFVLADRESRTLDLPLVR